MASFPKMTTTNDGNLLLAKAGAGTKLTFTKIVLGDGKLSGQSVSALHALISQKSFCDLSYGKRTDSTYQVGGLLLPDNITSGFYWREVGLLATDPDEGEILFAYANAGTATDYINPDTEDSRFEKNLYISIGVGSATDVTISVPSTDVYALQADLTEITKQMAELTSQGEIAKIKLQDTPINNDDGEPDGTLLFYVGE